jgi:hypothetical protein
MRPGQQQQQQQEQPPPLQQQQRERGRPSDSSAASLLDSPLFQSDLFRVNVYKVLSCSKRTPHDW